MTATASSLEFAPGIMGKRTERRERFLNLKQVTQNQPYFSRMSSWREGRKGERGRDRERWGGER